ncbi:hypothetical protein A2U01_0082410, partial [Trifolium medium]|nr:hypothetical protein [Trifolium medium]
MAAGWQQAFAAAEDPGR